MEPELHSTLAKPPSFWRLVARSAGWVLAAAPREFVLTVGAQIAGAVALAAVLLCGRDLATALTGPSPPETISELLPTILCLAVALFLSGLSVVIDREARFVLGELVARHLETEIIHVAGSVDYERFEEQRFNDLLTRAGDEGASSAEQIVYDLLALISSFATSVALLFVLATAVPSVLPVLVLVAIPFVLAARASAGLAFRTTYELTPSDRLRFAIFGTLVGSWEGKEIRVFGLQEPLRRRWSALYDDRTRRLRSVAIKRTLMNGAASLAASALVTGLLIIIVAAAMDDRIALADAAISIIALQQIAARVRSSSSTTGSLREAALFLTDFDEFYTLGSEGDARSAPEPLPPFTSMRVENVSFRYPGTERLVLDDVSIELERGEIVALVGVSGSGKTTLAHLLAGLYRPTSGRITWDDTDIASIPRSAYWRSLAVVYQDYVEYELTARENIAISDYHRLDDHEAVVAAARRANIDEAIERLPARYDTMLSRSYDEGATLSEGEWQRLAVARAFFREAPLLILDEPASALDPIAEQQLYERLVELCVDRSGLLISHRFSTVRMADRIYVLQNGRVVEHGRHQELLALDGAYANLFRVQAAGYVDSP
ncbi:MAG: ABC transporter ATP-binding protein [Acidimicrobiales bacterium]